MEKDDTDIEVQGLRLRIECPIHISTKQKASRHEADVLTRRQIMTWIQYGRLLCETLPNLIKRVGRSIWTIIKYVLGFIFMWLYAALLMGGGY